MKTPTLTEHIRDLEAKRLSAQRRESDAMAKIKRISGVATADGRRQLTAEEDRVVDAAMAEKRSAADEQTRLAGQLEEARRIADDEASIDAQLSTRDVTY